MRSTPHHNSPTLPFPVLLRELGRANLREQWSCWGASALAVFPATWSLALPMRVLSRGRGKALLEVRASATLRAKGTGSRMLPAAGSALLALCKTGKRLSSTQVVVKTK